MFVVVSVDVEGRPGVGAMTARDSESVLGVCDVSPAGEITTFEGFAGLSVI